MLALPDKPSIAVLPFQNMSGDPEHEYFADGIVEDIITGSQFKSLFVIARNSSLEAGFQSCAERANAPFESFTTVLRLDPIDPARAGAWAGLACAHNVLGDFEAGYEWATRAVEAETEMWTLAYFVINAVPAGRMQEARAAVRS